MVLISRKMRRNSGCPKYPIVLTAIMVSLCLALSLRSAAAGYAFEHGPGTIWVHACSSGRELSSKSTRIAPFGGRSDE